jgi:hypothetical protein
LCHETISHDCLLDSFASRFRRVKGRWARLLGEVSAPQWLV